MSLSASTVAAQIALMLPLPMTGGQSHAGHLLPFDSIPRVAEPTSHRAAGANTFDFRLLCASANHDVLAQIDSLAALEADWDGQGAAKPDSRSIEAAKSFMASGAGGSWEPTLHADGRAVLEWDEGGRYVELTFGTNNTVVVFSRSATGIVSARTLPLAALTSYAAIAHAA